MCLKMLRSKFIDKQSSSGQTLNLITDDVSNMDDFFYFMPYLISSPLKIAGSVALLVYMVGFNILTGTLVTFIGLLITIGLGRLKLIIKYIFVTGDFLHK